MNRIDRRMRIKAYRAENQCGIDEAKRAINREDLIADIHKLDVFSTFSEVRDLLLRVLEFNDR